MYWPFATEESILRRASTSSARCDTSCAGLKRVRRASTTARKGPKRGTSPMAKAVGGAATAANETMTLTT